jgi:hypothetical protein
MSDDEAVEASPRRVLKRTGIVIGVAVLVGGGVGVVANNRSVTYPGAVSPTTNTSTGPGPVAAGTGAAPVRVAFDITTQGETLAPASFADPPPTMTARKAWAVFADGAGAKARTIPPEDDVFIGDFSYPGRGIYSALAYGYRRPRVGCVSTIPPADPTNLPICRPWVFLDADTGRLLDGTQQEIDDRFPADPERFVLPRVSFDVPTGYVITHREVDSPPLPGGGVHRERTYFISNGNVNEFIHVTVRVGDDAQVAVTPRTFNNQVPNARWVRIGGIRVVDANPGASADYQWTLRPGVAGAVSGSKATAPSAVADIVRSMKINN